MHFTDAAKLQVVIAADWRRILHGTRGLTFTCRVVFPAVFCVSDTHASPGTHHALTDVSLALCNLVEGEKKSLQCLWNVTDRLLVQCSPVLTRAEVDLSKVLFAQFDVQ